MQPLPVDEPARPWRSEQGPRLVKAQLEVVNERGLHLRAAHVLAQLVSGMEAEVRVGRAKELVNAKSLLGLTTLGAVQGTMLDVEVEGPKARASMDRIKALFASGFEEGAPSA